MVLRAMKMQGALRKKRGKEYEMVEKSGRQHRLEIVTVKF